MDSYEQSDQGPICLQLENYPLCMQNLCSIQDFYVADISFGVDPVSVHDLVCLASSEPVGGF